MYKKITTYCLLGSLAIMAVATPACADKLCLKVLFNRKTQSIKTSSTVAASCPRGSTELVDTQRFTGPQGAPGINGATGATGAPGAPGAPGANGRDGVDGKDGINGTNGMNGVDGRNGIDGANGADGKFDVSSCRFEIKTFTSCAEGNVCNNIISCGASGLSGGSRTSDLLIHWAWDASNEAAYITSVGPVLAGTSPTSYPTGIGVASTSETGYGAHTPTIGMVCCLPQ